MLLNSTVECAPSLRETSGPLGRAGLHAQNPHSRHSDVRGDRCEATLRNMQLYISFAMRADAGARQYCEDSLAGQVSQDDGTKNAYDAPKKARILTPQHLC